MPDEGVLAVIGAATVAAYALIAAAVGVYAYRHLNPDGVTPRPTRRKGKRAYFWPFRPLAALVEGLLWPFSTARLVLKELH